ncbi:MAG: CHRD domain-containing protein [Steroidobacteraceae bacterium]
MNKIAIALATCLFSASASSAIVLTANLTNNQENPPASPLTNIGLPRTSSGSAIFTINDDKTAMSFIATIFGLDVTGSQSADTNDNLVAAHIHAGPLVTPTSNGPVVWGFFGGPFNDNNPNNFAMTPLASGVGGTFSGIWNAPEGNNTTLAAQLANILEGRAYINFHSTQFTGGEIRGALLPVPEPGTYALMLCGALVFVVRAAQRRRVGRAGQT